MNTSNTAQDLSKAALQSIDELSHAASRAVDGAQDMAEKAITKVQSEASDLTEKAPRLLDLAVERIKAMSARGVDVARETGTLAREKAVLATEQTSARIRQDPLKSMMIAVAAGAALAVAAGYLVQRRKAKQ